MFTIRSVEVENFKKIQKRLTINNLTPGLNIIAGDNEDGKSTLFQAIRAALFEKHTTRVATKYQPFDSVVRPQVAVEFELDGTQYKISKAFCQKPEALLETKGKSFSGAAAEEMLEELLGFETPMRGETSDKYQGMHGLLWVQQGDSHSLLHTLKSRQTLNSSLEQEVGDVLGGGLGDAILEKVRKDYSQYFGKNNKPIGQYRESEKKLTEINSKVTDAENQLAAYEEKIEQLTRLQVRLNQLTENKTLDKLESNLTVADQALQEASTLKTHVDKATQQCEMLKAKTELPKQQWVHRVSQGQRLDEVKSKIVATQSQIDNVKVNIDQDSKQINHLRKLISNLTDQQQKLNQALGKNRVEVSLGDASEDLLQLEKQLSQAKDVAAQLQQKKQELRTVKTPPSMIHDAEQLEQQIIKAKAALSATASHIDIKLNKQVIVGNELHSGHASIDIIEPTTITIPDIGTIQITPGNATGNINISKLKEWESRLAEILAQYDCQSIHSLKQRIQDSNRLQTEIAQIEKLILAHAPDGIAALEEKITQKRDEINLLNKPHNFALPIDIQQAKQKLNKLTVDLTETEKQLERFQHKLQQTQQSYNTASEEFHRLNAQANADKEFMTSIEQDLKKAREEISDQKLFQQLGDLKAELAKSETSCKEALSALTALHYDDLVLKKSMAEDALNETKRQIGGLEGDIHSLKIELRTQGQVGLGEELEKLKSEQLAMQSSYEAMDRQGKSAKLLKEILEKHASNAKQSFLLPVKQRIIPYLNSLIPETELTFDEELNLTGLMRDTTHEPFSALSRGTQEQLAILVRLAFADLLIEQKQPISVLLDDALVYSDAERFERMKFILRKASTKYQVIIMTCRESDYLSLGAPMQFMKELAVG